MLDPKTEESKRTIKLPGFALDALKSHRTRQNETRDKSGKRWQENGLVFPTTIGTPMEPRNLNRHLDGILKRTELEHITVHGIRHSAASIMEAMGISLKTISKILGHSTIQITADLYVHPYDEAMENAAGRMDDVFAPKNAS